MMMDSLKVNMGNVSLLDDQILDILGSGNSSLVEEFPYWKLAMAVRVIIVVFILIPLIIFFSGSVLFTFMVNKSLLKPINMVHILLISELFILKLVIIIVALFVFPDVVRYCICPEIINDIYFPLSAFNIAFVNVVLACLSIVQFLIIKGKKRLVGWKVVSLLLSGSTVYSMVWGVAGYIINRIQRIQPICVSVCEGIPETTFSTYTLLLVGLIITVVLPCLVVIFIALLWTCVIFKKSYIGDDNQLNRRIISLPIIMPLVTIFASIFYFILREIFENILRQIVQEYFANWVLISNELLGHILEGASGFIYPVMLLYFHPQLRSSWYITLKYVPRKVFGKKMKRNSVHPEDDGMVGKSTLMNDGV